MRLIQGLGGTVRDRYEQLVPAVAKRISRALPPCSYSESDENEEEDVTSGMSNLKGFAAAFGSLVAVVNSRLQALKGEQQLALLSSMEDRLRDYKRSHKVYTKDLQHQRHRQAMELADVNDDLRFLQRKVEKLQEQANTERHRLEMVTNNSLHTSETTHSTKKEDLTKAIAALVEELGRMGEEHKQAERVARNRKNRMLMELKSKIAEYDKAMTGLQREYDMLCQLTDMEGGIVRELGNYYSKVSVVLFGNNGKWARY